MLTRRDMLKSAIGIAASSMFVDSLFANSSKEIKFKRPTEEPPVIKQPTELEKLWRELQKEKLKIYEKWRDVFPPEKRKLSEARMLASWLALPYRVEFACLLENQKLYNECSPSDSYRDYYNLITKQIWRNNSPRGKIGISYQSMLGPCSIAFYKDPKTGQLNGEPLAATAHKLKVSMPIEAMQDLVRLHGIDPIDELIKILGQEIDIELQRRILVDIINGSEKILSYGDDPRKIINYRALIIQQRLNPNLQFNKWAVVSPKTCDKLDIAQNNFWFGLHGAGRIKDQFGDGYIEIIVDALAPDNRIIIGCNKDLFTGYVFMPYISLIPEPLRLDPDSFVPRRPLITRFAKKLVNSNFFSVVDYECVI